MTVGASSAATVAPAQRFQAAMPDMGAFLLATQATIASRAYHHAVRAREPEAEVIGKACPLLVPAIEEGRGPDDPVVRMILSEYLAPLREEEIDTLILGCTHYPVIRKAVEEEMGGGVTIVDSAKETAHRTRDFLAELGLLERSRKPGRIRVYVSDNPAEVRKRGTLFLGDDMPPVELVTPEQFYEEFLNRVVSALAAVGGAVWTVSDEGGLALSYQINLPQAQLAGPEESRQRHGRLLYRALREGEALLVPPRSGAEGDEALVFRPLPAAAVAAFLHHGVVGAVDDAGEAALRADHELLPVGVAAVVVDVAEDPGLAVPGR